MPIKLILVPGYKTTKSGQVQWCEYLCKEFQTFRTPFHLLRIHSVCTKKRKNKDNRTLQVFWQSIQKPSCMSVHFSQQAMLQHLISAKSQKHKSKSEKKQQQQQRDTTTKPQQQNKIRNTSALQTEQVGHYWIERLLLIGHRVSEGERISCS